MSRNPIDRPLLIIIISLVVAGFLIYLSASLSLLARDSIKLSSVLFNHVLLGLVVGTLGLYIASIIHYRTWRKYAFYFFILAVIVNLLVFVPGIGFEYGGAKRWILLGPISFQPSEFLKIAYVIYLATWLSGVRDKVKSLRYGLLPFLLVTGIVGAILLLQPDTDIFAVIFAAGISMFLVSGARARDIGILFLSGAGGLAALAFLRPYVMDRILTFFSPDRDPLGAGYQIQQSLIAIGSGDWLGRGFGQSLQKFNFLPEPIGDSIFAVAAEEFGFIGGMILISLFFLLAIRGLKLARHSQDFFGGLLAVGIVILIVSQSFINIAAMLGIVPLSGLPLIFVSHGGTSMLFSLFEVGILLNISRYQLRT